MNSYQTPKGLQKEDYLEQNLDLMNPQGERFLPTEIEIVLSPLLAFY